MSDDRERGSDGLLIGILVVLVVLVIGGLGMAVFRFRYARVDRERAVMEAERARYAEQQALIALEKATQAAETAGRIEQEKLKNEAPVDTDAGTEQPGRTSSKPD